MKLDQVAVIMTDGHTQSMTVSMCVYTVLQQLCKLDLNGTIILYIVFNLLPVVG